MNIEGKNGQQDRRAGSHSFHNNAKPITNMKAMKPNGIDPILMNDLIRSKLATDAAFEILKKKIVTSGSKNSNAG